MRISDWSSDVCSSDLRCGTSNPGSRLPLLASLQERWEMRSDARPRSPPRHLPARGRIERDAGFGQHALEEVAFAEHRRVAQQAHELGGENGSASCRERECQYV